MMIKEPKMTTKKKRKVLVGWIYEDDDCAFHNMYAYSDSVEGLYFCLLKRKKSLGKFKGKKVRITVQEL